MEINTKQLLGIVLTLITLSSGATVVLKDSGKYMNCMGGWVLQETGKYDCPTRDIEPQWCHHGSEEGPENIGYRCYLGLVIKDTAEVVKVNANGKWWECEVINGKVNSYSKCYSSIYESYLGEII